ncbi:MAG: hypothetical protein PHI34_03510 [Acidobacteriota bacterium]|nr:hypothetical protein [Acidobacteriota bacterium]
MPYRRSGTVPSAEVLVSKFEAAIKSLVQRFRNHPYAFYTETDMHCYLYHRLYSGGLANGLYHTIEGYDTILLHKEYPTVARCSRGDDGHLRESVDGRRRGAFDICIWDPAYIAGRDHRKQKVLCAAELALNETRRGNPHTINDTTKLAGPENEIKYGYLLFFVRDDPCYEDNKEEIWANLNDAAKRVRVAFAQVNGSKKPKPQYLPEGAWFTPFSLPRKRPAGGRK